MMALKDIALFSKIEEKQLQSLQAQMHVHEYSKGSVVFYEGDKSEYLHILLDGEVKLYKTTPKGTQVHMHHFTAPEIIALFAVFEHVAFPATCEFLTDGAVGLLPLTKIYEYLQNVEFSIALITALSRRMKLLSDVLHKEMIFSSEAKIADLVMTNPSIFKHIKNTEIASMLNMTPETLSRILSKFKQEKIITIKAHVVNVLDKNRLQDVMITNRMIDKE